MLKALGFLLLSSLALATGGREGSGGGGIACYDSNQRLLSVQTLEFFEYYPPLTPVLEGTSADEILADLQKFFEKYSPIFASRLKMVSKHINLKTWEKFKALPKIEDATPIKAIPKNCKFVQLAVRYTTSKPGVLPEAEVQFNQDLFKRLSPFNQALLIFHEQLYLIGKETGHKRSDTLRKTIAFLASKELRDRAQEMPFNQAAYYVQGLLVDIFGDYYRFFIEDPTDRPKYIPQGYNQWSRYVSFGKFLMGARDRKNQCLAYKNYDKLPQDQQAKVQDECSFLSLHPDYLPQVTTDEEAFLFMSRWVLGRAGAIQNSEMFVVWDWERPETLTDEQASELGRACDFLRKSDYVHFRKMVAKSIDYCNAIGR